MSPDNTLRTTEQNRASFAYLKVQEAKGALRQDSAKEYKSYLKKFPTMIKTNGLGQALAFSKAKASSNKAYARIYADLGDWLRRPEHGILNSQPGDELMGEVVQLDSLEYRQLTLEALALLQWMRRFAEGLIEGEAAE